MNYYNLAGDEYAGNNFHSPFILDMLQYLSYWSIISMILDIPHQYICSASLIGKVEQKVLCMYTSNGTSIAHWKKLVTV